MICACRISNKLLNIIKNIYNIELNNILNIDEYKNNYLLKIQKRFENKLIYDFEDADKIYNVLINKLNKYCEENIKKNIVSIIHGDFWFSNILLTYTDEYKFIDMKGIVNENETLSGDKIYDYAKLLQSLIGFDSILYDKEINLKYNNKFITYFKNWIQENEKDIEYEDIKTICSILMFGVFHAYNNENMNNIKKNKIISMIKQLI
jgi:hypothetical protein